jgi:hypothetical protein
MFCGWLDIGFAHVLRHSEVLHTDCAVTVQRFGHCDIPGARVAAG